MRTNFFGTTNELGMLMLEQGKKNYNIDKWVFKIWDYSCKWNLYEMRDAY